MDKMDRTEHPESLDRRVCYLMRIIQLKLFKNYFIIFIIKVLRVKMDRMELQERSAKLDKVFITVGCSI